MSDKLYEHIDLAKKFEGKPEPVQESTQQAGSRTTEVSLNVMKHLAESKPAEAEPTRLEGSPVPN